MGNKLPDRTVLGGGQKFQTTELLRGGKKVGKKHYGWGEKWGKKKKVRGAGKKPSRKKRGGVNIRGTKKTESERPREAVPEGGTPKHAVKVKRPVIRADNKHNGAVDLAQHGQNTAKRCPSTKPGCACGKNVRTEKVTSMWSLKKRIKLRMFSRGCD